ncbi:MAG: DUF882 domain-containing protein [Hyphomicrobiales bacterium]|nr:DUF882 domain-containing protein [Hyphomicrobiales bacterium]
MADRKPLRISGLVLALTAALSFFPISLEGADANGDTRTISIFNVHTNENATVTFKRNGVYDADGLKQLSWVLRDWRRDEPTSMSPRLFDILWEVHQESGSQEAFHAVSGYRAPETNAMLRRSSHLVAEHSQHMLGKAMDSYLPDVPIERMREIAMHMQRGGVGYYPTSGSPFVHIDAGSVRSWPRMTRDQLARLFPDGKTVHLPADGHPLPGYEEAKAEILAAGGTVAGITAYAEADQVSNGHHKSLWAALFGGADEDEDAAIAASGRTLSRAAAARQPTQVAALASNANDAGVHAFIMSQAETSASVQGSANAPAQTPATTSRSRNVQAGRATEPAVPADTGARAAAPALPSFLSALRGDTTNGTTTDTGTTVAVRSAPQAQTGTTVALRSDAAETQQAEPSTASEIAAFAPLPPARPKSLMDIASLVDIPLPPARPNDIGLVDPHSGGVGAQAIGTQAIGTQAIVTQPNVTEPTAPATLVALDHPLPPARPQVFALAASATLVSDAQTIVAAPVIAAGSAAVQNTADVNAASDTAVSKAELVRLDHPLPPARPVQFAMALPMAGVSATETATGVETSAGPSHRSINQDGVLALFDNSALVSTRHLQAAEVKVVNAVVRTALPKLAQDAMARPSSTAGHFMISSSPPITNHFAGRAVEPLKSLGFAPTE